MAVDDGRVVSNFIVQGLRGGPFTVFGDGNQTRSFCYVDDLVDGLVRTSRVASVPGPINLGNPREFAIIDLVREIAAILGAPLNVVKAPLPADDPRQRKPDITRARELLGFEPTVQLRQGLEHTIEDFRGRLSALKNGGART
jgi:UDP-glucuronate decarboxylase